MKLVTSMVSASVVACVLALTGCGGGAASPEGDAIAPTEGAGLFMTSLIREKASGQYELAWRSLHPFHQHIAPRAEYIQCENQTTFPGTLLKVAVLRVKDEPVLIAGESHTVASKAVTIRVSVRSPGVARLVVVVDTYHAVPVSGHWTWILTRGNFAEYKAGHCPGSVPQTPKV